MSSCLHQTLPPTTTLTCKQIRFKNHNIILISFYDTRHYSRMNEVLSVPVRSGGVCAAKATRVAYSTRSDRGVTTQSGEPQPLYSYPQSRLPVGDLCQMSTGHKFRYVRRQRKLKRENQKNLSLLHSSNTFFYLLLYPYSACRENCSLTLVTGYKYVQQLLIMIVIIMAKQFFPLQKDGC